MYHDESRIFNDHFRCTRDVPPVSGRHGGRFSTFGDYSVDLFEKFRGSPTERPLFDMAAVAIVKNPKWADRVTMGAPKFVDGLPGHAGNGSHFDRAAGSW